MIEGYQEICPAKKIRKPVNNEIKQNRIRLQRKGNSNFLPVPGFSVECGSLGDSDAFIPELPLLRMFELVCFSNQSPNPSVIHA